MNYDLPRALRLSAGRTLLAVSRVLARHGAHLIGHPSTQAVRTPLEIVRDAPVRRWRYEA